MKICILEDEKTQTERMTEYLTRYQREHGDFDYVLETYSRAFDLLDAYRGDADLLFLDIRLPDQLGIETARRIREKDPRVMIVFVTNLAQYAIEGYSVRAFDYILKPVEYFILFLIVCCQAQKIFCDGMRQHTISVISNYNLA